MELREAKSSLRRYHDEEIIRMEREHEEKIISVLRLLANKESHGGDNNDSLGGDIDAVEKTIKIQAEELEKMADLHDKLMKKDEEVADLKSQLQRSTVTGGGKLFTNPGIESPIRTKKQTKRVTIVTEQYTNSDEFFNDQDFSSNDEDSDDDEDMDEEWRKTPIHRRIYSERKSLGPQFAKRKRGSFDSEEEDDHNDESLSKKRNSSSTGKICPGFSLIVAYSNIFNF